MFWLVKRFKMTPGSRKLIKARPLEFSNLTRVAADSQQSPANLSLIGFGRRLCNSGHEHLTPHWNDGMNFKHLALLLTAAACTVGAVGAEENAQPNILLIMADDIGIEGLGCYGGMSYRTPHLDRMASEGLRFTTAYSQPLCTPTRVQIMTGKYNHRNWTCFGILDPKERTFGHHLKAAGYQTGIFGKWQLQSYDPPDLPNADSRRGTGMHPKDAGFDEYALFHSLHTEDKGSRYANPVMLEGTAESSGTLREWPGKYGEDISVEKILGFFDKHKGKPTFVYYPMALPHRPFEPTPHSDNWDPKNVPEEDVKYIKDMTEYMDTVVGRLIDGLKERKLDKNTLVLFYGDNGYHRAVYSRLDDGRTIRGGKGEPLQTGFHVPLIAWWPGRVKPGVCSDIIDASDFMPTLLDVAHAPLKKDVKTDGHTFYPQLMGQKGEPREAAFFWYDPRPGWDKERFRRHVFAVNRTHKLFRSGRLIRLGEKPLEEEAIDPLNMTAADKAARQHLTTFMSRYAQETEPPLVTAYGVPLHDLHYVPKSKRETTAINTKLLATGEEHFYGDHKDQRLWIFKPLDAEPEEQRPCVFFIHGGGWGGTPSALAPKAVYFQRRGYTTVSIHFRAPGKGATPHDSLRDARAAYRWIVKNASQHNIDADRIVVSGGSAGGHLSLALSTLALEGDPVLEHLPQAMVLFNPVIDLVDGWSGGRKKCEQAGIDPRSFSPAHHVRSGLPPVLVLSGSDDRLITPKQLSAFQKRMQDAGNRCDVTIYPDAGHGFFNYGRPENRHFQWTMWAFEDYLNQL